MTVQYAQLKQVKRVDVPRATLMRATDIYGYGTKIPIDYMVKVTGSKQWLRVYMVFTSNAPTYYVSTKTNKFLVVEYSDIKTCFGTQRRNK